MTNPTASSITDHYLAALLSHPAVATVSSFGSKPVSVEAVYLHRTLLQEVQRNVQQKASGRAAERNELQPAQEADRVVTEKLPIDLWPKVKTDRVVLIEGPAGMGKSTLTKHLVQESYAQHHQIPIWIPFRTFVASARPLRDHLEQDYIPWLGLADVRVPQAGPDHMSLGQWLYNQWGSSQAVLILDGLDEVIDPVKRQKALDGLLSMGPNSWRPLTILTSRPLSHSLPLVTAKVELQALTPDEQMELINRHQTPLKLSPERIVLFQQQVGLSGAKAASSSPVRSLLERPGHLVAILRVYAKTGHVLETETEVFSHLLEERLTGRSESSADLAKKRQVLEGLALHLLACRQGQIQTRAQIVGLVEQVLQEHDAAGTPLFPLSQASALLHDFVQNSGLLTRLGLEPERYQFESVIWQEFLAGGALANARIINVIGMTEEQVLKFLDKKAWDQEYESVLKSWVGHTDNPFPLFERLIDRAKDDMARHRLGTAGRCLFEVSPALRERPEYQALSVQIPSEAFEVWKGNAEQGTELLVETSLRNAWKETAIGQEKLVRCIRGRFERIRRMVADVLFAVKCSSCAQVYANRIIDYSLARHRAVTVLQELGATMPARSLVALLTQEDLRVRDFAIEALKGLGTAMPDWVQQALLAQFNQQEFPYIREKALEALMQLGSAMPGELKEELLTQLAKEDLSSFLGSSRAKREFLKFCSSTPSEMQKIARQKTVRQQEREDELTRKWEPTVKVLGQLGEERQGAASPETVWWTMYKSNEIGGNSCFMAIRNMDYLRSVVLNVFGKRSTELPALVQLVLDVSVMGKDLMFAHKAVEVLSGLETVTVKSVVARLEWYLVYNRFMLRDFFFQERVVKTLTLIQDFIQQANHRCFLVNGRRRIQEVNNLSYTDPFCGGCVHGLSVRRSMIPSFLDT